MYTDPAIQPGEGNSADVLSPPAADGQGGWVSMESWQARVYGIRTQYARDDEDALLNATLKL